MSGPTIEQAREEAPELVRSWAEVSQRHDAAELNGGVSDELRAVRHELAEEVVRCADALGGDEAEVGEGFMAARMEAEEVLAVAEGGIEKATITGLPRFMLTDLGNAERFAVDHGGELLFVPGLGWHTWDDRRFALDRDGEAMRRAKQTARLIHREASEVSGKDLAKQVTRHAHASESRPRLEAMLRLAESEQPLVAMPERLDANPDALNVENGTVDLRTGKLREHNRADLMTRLAPVEFDPDARCPIWIECLQTWLGDGGVEPGYLQRAVGYSLTGATTEQCLFVLDGEGANGKTTFLETIAALVGDYGASAEAATFMASRAGGVRSDLARLRGRRFVRAAEVEEGDRFAEVLVKQLTGGDTVVARFLYRDEFEFRPAFKLWLAANRLPEVRGTDHAIWRRIRRVPFPTKITQPDRDLPTKLRAELPGILNWALDGALAWRREGLAIAEAVEQATHRYRREQDSVGEFIETCCRLGAELQASPTELRDSYEVFCEAEGFAAVPRNTFWLSLSRRGLSRGRDRESRWWSGIAVGHKRGGDSA